MITFTVWHIIHNFFLETYVNKCLMFEEKRKQSINAVVFVCCFAVTFDDIEMTQIYDVQKPLSNKR